jgi:F-type H+-transporting ATPase subunit b
VQIDFLTLSAQIINFLVLVLLLRHFLYKRIIDVMNERETGIASLLREAEQKKKESEQERESYRKKEQELLDKREGMAAEIREEIEAMRKDLTNKARDEVEENKARWYEDIERQKEAFLIDLRRRASEEIFTVARRALHDLADEELEQRMINTFIKRLKNMEENEKKAIKDQQKPQQELIIKSAFEIPEAMRRSIQEALQEQINSDVNLQFKTSPELICGIELDAYGMRITWGLDSYLDSLEENLSMMLERKVSEEPEVNEKGSGK